MIGRRLARDRVSWRSNRRSKISIKVIFDGTLQKKPALSRIGGARSPCAAGICRWNTVSLPDADGGLPVPAPYVMPDWMLSSPWRRVGGRPCERASAGVGRPAMSERATIIVRPLCPYQRQTYPRSAASFPFVMRILRYQTRASWPDVPHRHLDGAQRTDPRPRGQRAAVDPSPGGEPSFA